MCCESEQNLIEMNIIGQKESFQKLVHSDFSIIFPRSVLKILVICLRTVNCYICFGAFCINFRGTVGNRASPEVQMKTKYFMYYEYHSGIGVKKYRNETQKIFQQVNLAKCVDSQYSGLYFS